MGGEVLELLNDRAKRMQREAFEQGFREGYAEECQEMVAAMTELGYSQEAIDAVVSTPTQDELSSKVARALQNFVPQGIVVSDILQAVGNDEFR